MRTPANEAEKIKKKHGCALVSLIPKEETIEVPSVGGRKPRVVSRQILGEIIEPRVEELFQLVNREIIRSGYDGIVASGVVLTGGTASLEGISDLAEQVFNLPVKCGLPSGISGLVDIVNSPMYATAVGLVLYGKRHATSAQFRVGGKNNVGKLINKMKGWVGDFF